MMMYPSMNLQAMYAGVVSKYIQNSSLKVFLRKLFALFFKKALFLQQTIMKKVLNLWRDSRLRVGFHFFSFCRLYSWSLVQHMKEREERSRAGDTLFLTCHFWRKSKEIPPSGISRPARHWFEKQKKNKTKKKNLGSSGPCPLPVLQQHHVFFFLSDM